MTHRLAYLMDRTKKLPSTVSKLDSGSIITTTSAAAGETSGKHARHTTHLKTHSVSSHASHHTHTDTTNRQKPESTYRRAQTADAYSRRRPKIDHNEQDYAAKSGQIGTSGSVSSTTAQSTASSVRGNSSNGVFQLTASHHQLSSNVHEHEAYTKSRNSTAPADVQLHTGLYSAASVTVGNRIANTDVASLSTAPSRGAAEWFASVDSASEWDCSMIAAAANRAANLRHKRYDFTRCVCVTSCSHTQHLVHIINAFIELSILGV